MKKSKGVQFIKTTVIGGLLFLVPVGFLGFILFKAFDFMLKIAEPMADWLPIDTIGGVALANLIAIAAIILVSFIAGLIARSSLAKNAVDKLESRVLMKLPGYTLIKGIKGGFESEETPGFKPVALTLGTAERIGLEIQKLTDGRSMVFIPSAPNALSGITQILPPEQVTYLDVPITQIMDFAERYGHGVEELLATKVSGTTAQTE
ncbi:MAG: hypothetical protein HKN57_08530 [Xanthomonadales bacterium]|nr:hypothetical protein [Gammaproteobacteria bacterium]MBT8053771.1 hypothetical protein [Gammaproteobacteria bacterium]NND57286.1 hypothetical protein [Xanthomonadales bacterium]NNK51608.1 hypothetical protein [Xanthomonadales bacterium]